MSEDSSIWVLIGLACLGTASWRLLGVVIGDRIPKDSIWSEWINAVAYAMVAGVMMLIVVFPTGVMASSALSWRLVALAVALVLMMVTRSFMASVIGSVLSFVVMSYVFA
ncbi:MAG: AzlD domain-containing protein [Alphaproteobacteria bacterium]|nr:AzlD domain-containing protein [Alphaproteobacteria bacterium]